jgi:hypothetical protein
MKKLLILFLFTFTIQNAVAQACGIHYVNYTGTIDVKGFEVASIEVPNSPFFYGLMEENEEGTFFPVTPESTRFELRISSHLTSPVTTVEAFLHTYKRKRESIPILITIKKNGSLEKHRIELSWEAVQMTQIEDFKNFPQFEFKLGVLKL